jgi:hypothetical protein
MLSQIKDDRIPQDLAIQKLVSATITAYSRIGLLENKIESMTAAKRYKDEINRSKRRIAQVSGQLGSMYIATARKAIQLREAKEQAKAERKQARLKLKQQREQQQTQQNYQNYSEQIQSHLEDYPEERKE